MKRKLLSSLALISALFFASCSAFEIMDQQDDNTAVKADDQTACVTIALEENSRTALPIPELTDFKTITLEGSSLAQNAIPVDTTWVAKDTAEGWKLAFQNMKADKIVVTAGATYKFVLKACLKNGATWEGTLERSIVKGTNQLSFVISLKELPTQSDSGAGGVSVILTVPDEVKACDAVLKTIDETNIISDSYSPTFSNNKVDYSTNRDIPAGNYVLVFTLYGDEEKTLKIGEWREYVAIAKDVMSVSRPVIESVRSIHTVKFWRNQESAWRTKSVVHGSKVMFNEIPAYADGSLIFVGWYTSDRDTAFDLNTPITSDMDLYAKCANVACSYATSDSPLFTNFAFDDNRECKLWNCGDKVYLKIEAGDNVTYKIGSEDYKGLDQNVAIPLNIGWNDIYIKFPSNENEYHLKVESVFNRVTGLEASADRDTDGYNVVNLKWNSYDGDSRVKAAGDKGGYFLDARKKSWNPGYSTLMSVDDLQNIPSSLEDIENIESKDYFSLKITSDDLKNGTYSIKELPSGTDYCFYLVAYGGIKEGTTALLNAQAIGSVLVRTAGNPTAELNIYGHYVYDYQDHEGGTAGQYYWCFSEASDEDPLGLSGFNLYETIDYGSPSVGDVIDMLYGECDKGFGSGRFSIEMISRQDLSQRLITYFAFLDEKKQTAKEKQHFILKGDKYCTTAKFSKNDNNKDYTKCVTKTINRTKSQSFTYEWNAWEYDYSSPDDYLGKVTATFTYNTLTDTWTCVWSSTCGASGKSTIRAGERTGKDNGSKDDGLRWELHNTDEGELEFHWDWGWDEEQ